VNILYVQETKWKGQKVKEVEDTGFKLWYTGTTANKNGVGIVLDKSLKDQGFQVGKSSRVDKVPTW
jgi:exonuclease III